MTAAEAEAAGTLDAWLADVLTRVEARLAEAESRERALLAREQRIQAAIAEARKV